MHDHFWKTDAVVSMMDPAGQDFDAVVFCPTFNTGDTGATASFSIGATFVQFTDATWWGRSVCGQGNRLATE